MIEIDGPQSVRDLGRSTTGSGGFVRAVPGGPHRAAEPAEVDDKTLRHHRHPCEDAQIEIRDRTQIDVGHTPATGGRILASEVGQSRGTGKGIGRAMGAVCIQTAGIRARSGGAAPLRAAGRIGSLSTTRTDREGRTPPQRLFKPSLKWRTTLRKCSVLSLLAEKQGKSGKNCGIVPRVGKTFEKGSRNMLSRSQYESKRRTSSPPMRENLPTSQSAPSSLTSV